MKRLVLAVAAMGVFLVGSPAQAQLDDAVIRYGFNDSFGTPNSQIFTGAATFSDPFTTITANGFSQPSLSVDSYRGSPDRESSGNVTLSYDFSYTATSQAEFDQLLAPGSQIGFAGLSRIGDSRASGPGFFSLGVTNLSVFGTGLSGETEFVCGLFGQDTTGCGVHSFDVAYDTSGFIIDSEIRTITGSLSLRAFSQNGGDGVQVDHSWAFIDPIISLRGNGLDPARFTLQLSPGIGNGGFPLGGVPEPGAWAMMLLGFALAGRAVRLGRKPLAIA
jgi:PEP-CTERM motif